MQLRETEIRAKLMFTFMGYCCFLLLQSQRSQPGLGAVAVLSPPQAAGDAGW